MRQFLIMFGVFLFGVTSYPFSYAAGPTQTYAAEYADKDTKEKEIEPLYARSAVLMDADSGRVLFEKNGDEARAMASTTKIMTCILALEKGDVDTVVTASEYAAGQPKVHLGMQQGERFYLHDLLYSLMLESHNDSAAAIAEHIGGSVEGFAKLMNEKAAEIGCQKTHFITPNGLDASDEGGKHATTAKELAMIMRYCIKESPQSSLFLKITQTPNRTFSNIEGTRSFSCNNHNAFLQMMEGALSGKTGFTGDAGYCYVGALKRGEKSFIVALLACGWPNHKGYKWEDTRKLMEYGLANYEYRELFQEQRFPKVEIKNGIPKDGTLFGRAAADIKLDARKEERSLRLLLNPKEKADILVDVKKEWYAPLKRGQQVGSVTYVLEGRVLRKYPVIVTESVEEKHFLWYFQKLAEKYIRAALPDSSHS